MPSYLELIAANSVRGLIKSATSEQSPVPSLHHGYVASLGSMRRALEQYVSDETLRRPFLYLLAGPPGSGKSHLLRRLQTSINPGRFQGILTEEVNLSELDGTSELRHVFSTIRANHDRHYFTVTLFDEFDVRWGNSSAVRFLINPIYDGRYWEGGRFDEFGKAAFFFSGGYFRDLEIFNRVNRTTSINLPRFLSDLWVSAQRRFDERLAFEVQRMQEFCRSYQEWSLSVDPSADVVTYLRNLEKMPDFLSRIGGNVLPMIDLSFPANVTNEVFALEPGVHITPSAHVPMRDFLHWLSDREARAQQLLHYDSLWGALLDFKNMLLSERLLRTVQLLISRFGPEFRRRREPAFFVDRFLLNFLAFVPLRFSMRSLERLIANIRLPEGNHIEVTDLEAVEIFDVVDRRGFADPTEVWRRLLLANPDFGEKVRTRQANRFVRFPVAFG